MTPAVRTEGVVKTFPGVRAVDGVDFEAGPGEIHAVVGENGAGKTTLMRVLGGLTRPDSGTVFVEDREVAFRSALDAARAGIGMVHQHLTLVPVFTVLENIALGHEPSCCGGHDRLRSRVIETARRLDFKIDPDAVVADLAIGEKQRVEILRRLIHGARILIFDEPTDVLTPAEAGELFGVLSDLRDAGRTVLFVSHRLREVLSVADRVTVLRRGRRVGTVRTAETDERELARLMVGREVLPGGPRPGTAGAVRLEVRSLGADSDRGLPAVKGIDLEIRSGEITGIAGVTGNGQGELFEAILGLREISGGVVRLCDRDANRWSVRERRRCGLTFVPEDRDALGLVPSLTVEDNLSLLRVAAGSFLIAPGSVRRRAEEAIADFDVRPPDPAAVVEDLSGGNRQKLVLAQALDGKPSVVLLAEPTRGLDVGAVEATHARIRAVRDRGAAVLLASSDIGELLSLSDRIVVMFAGRLVGEVVPGTTTEEELGLMMSGGRP